MRRADSRAACTAGSRRAMSSPMMAITTRTSISVNPRQGFRFLMTRPPSRRKFCLAVVLDGQLVVPCRHGGRCLQGHNQCGPRALADDAVDPDLAAVGLGDGAADRKAEPGAVRLPA